MSSAIPSTPSSGFTTEEIAQACAEIFVNVAAVKASGHAPAAAEILSTPIEAFGIDSLTAMEFVMAVEERFSVELDEKALIDRGKTIGELAVLVAAARRPA